MGAASFLLAILVVLYVCQMSHNRKYNVFCATLNSTFPPFLLNISVAKSPASELRVQISHLDTLSNPTRMFKDPCKATSHPSLSLRITNDY